MDMSYDPKKVNVNVDGTIITGFSSDGIITISKNEDAVTPNVGCQGDVVYEENANESGTIALTLQGTSPSLAKLRSLAVNRKKFSVYISDANEDDSIAVSAQNCRILKAPDISRGKTSGTATVNIYVPKLTLR
ncbi:MAG: DUF3277 family protein [Lachnospiraceae bacterium]|jgi:hypothetical protein|nr:DUF3277 family protein [Lachnospiraceae bacterium]